MDNTISNYKIPRISAFIDRFITRMKFFAGNDVQIGKEYIGWETTDGSRFDGICQTLQYDGKYLYLFEKDCSKIVMLYGDMADFQERLIADHRWSVYDFLSLQKQVKNYMHEQGIQVYTTDVGRKALWLKMAPRELIAERVRVYEMTKDIQ